MNSEIASNDGVVDVADWDCKQLRKWWAKVQGSRHAIADELGKFGQSAGGLDKTDRRQLNVWRDWFLREHELESALERPDIMSFLLPSAAREEGTGAVVSNSGALNSNMSPAEIAKISDRVFMQLNFSPSISQRVWHILRYPLLVASLVGLLWFVFVIWLAPTIREIVLDFGIEVPLLTRLIMGELPHLHIASWCIAGIGLLFAIFCIVQSKFDKARPANNSWMDRQLMSTRRAVGIWAWHISVLLRLGLSAKDAATIAAKVSGNHWLKQQTNDWLHASQEQTAKLGPMTQSPFSLVSTAMKLPDSDGKADLLRQAAVYYLDRDRAISDWWFRVLALLIMWNMIVAGVLIFMIFYASFIAVIGGLTAW